MRFIGAGIDFNNLVNRVESLASGNARTIVNDGAYHDLTNSALFFFSTNDWLVFQAVGYFQKGAVAGPVFVRLLCSSGNGGVINAFVPNTIIGAPVVLYKGFSDIAANGVQAFRETWLVQVLVGGTFTIRWEALSGGSNLAVGVSDFVSEIIVLAA